MLVLLLKEARGLPNVSARWLDPQQAAGYFPWQPPAPWWPPGKLRFPSRRVEAAGSLAAPGEAVGVMAAPGRPLASWRLRGVPASILAKDK
jgi:hypothetical protein